jgi:hypothetical protein
MPRPYLQAGLALAALGDGRGGRSRTPRPELRQFFVRIARRRRSKIARIAVARRLLALAYHALRSENGCRSYPVNPATMVEARSLAVMASADGRQFD